MKKVKDEEAMQQALRAVEKLLAIMQTAEIDGEGSGLDQRVFKDNT